MLTFDTEPDETIDHFQKENLEDKISDIRKQTETKITLNIGGFKFVTSKQTFKQGTVFFVKSHNNRHQRRILHRQTSKTL